ncbi:MAG: hypothetical protein QXW79_00425 [Thermoplasmata archaeon]
MVLIGLMGPKQSGKSTVAQFLVKKYNFIERSMAEPLKRACKELFLLREEQLFGTREKEEPDPRWFGCTPRKMLQFVGTDLLRNHLNEIMPGLGRNIFIHHFRIWYMSEIQRNPKINIVVPDIRFQNEVNFIKELGGFIIKINRPGIESNDLHSSETELLNINNYDYLINNSGTIDDLFDSMMICMKNFYK